VAPVTKDSPSLYDRPRIDHRRLWFRIVADAVFGATECCDPDDDHNDD
jgi:hypothetical protein